MSQVLIESIVNDVVVETQVIQHVTVGIRGLPGTPGQPGSFATTWRGPWSDSAEYEAGDVVSYLGSAFVALEDVDGDPPTSHLGEWEPVAEGAYQAWLSAGNTGSVEDFLEALKGDAGASAYEVAVSEGFSGSEAEWLESLVGEDGAAATIAVGTVSTGDPGSDVQVTNSGTESAAVLNFTIPSGLPGTPGQEVSLRTDSGFIQWRLGDGEWSNLIALEDLEGAPGADGLQVELQATDTHIQWRHEGEEWSNLVALSALQGPAGNDGNDGADGLSAYEVAVQEGFVGDEEAWLASLVGPPGAQGEPGEASTVPGPAGEDGASAYEVAVDNGFVGTEEQWLASLKGDPGEPGEPGVAGPGVPSGGSTGQLLAKASGDDFDGEWVDPPSGGASTAAEVSYDNETSELEAEDVQAAIDELVTWINGLSWTAPNYETAELPENPPPGELAFDSDTDRLQVGQGDGWESVAYLSDIPAPGGDVTGPGSSVDGELVVFDGTSGKAIKAAPSGLSITSDAVVLSKQLVKHQGTASVVSAALAVDFLGPSRLIVTYAGAGISIDLSATNLAAGREVELLFNNVGSNPPQLELHSDWRDAGAFPMTLPAGQWVVVTLRSTASSDAGVFVTVAPFVDPGHVTGPVSSTSGNLAVFADASGKVLSDGGPVPVVGGPLTINAQTGTTYTPVLADGDGKTLVTLANAAEVKVTIPTNAVVAYPVGTVLVFKQMGVGQVVIEGDTGVTINGTTPGDEALVDEQYKSQGVLVQHATDVWTLTGWVE